MNKLQKIKKQKRKKQKRGKHTRKKTTQENPDALKKKMKNLKN